jgi:hypothetical protein
MLPVPITSTPSLRSPRQRLPQRKHFFRAIPDRQRHLHDRHIGLRVQVHQRHPGAVVQRALRIGLRGDARLLQQAQHLPAQLA